MNTKSFCLLAIIAVLLSACSGNAYQNAVPKDCVALAAVDMKALADDGGADEQRLAEMQTDGIITIDGNTIRMTHESSPFVRNVAALLDPLMQHTTKAFSKPV